jgi:hypothetical protein
MEYQVPQFIEVEDKIVGPLTLKQFIYVAGAAGLCVIFFVYFSLIIALLLSAPVAGLAGVLAFYKVNGKSFIEVLEAGFNYYTGAKLLIWGRKDKIIEEKSAATAAAAAAEKHSLSVTPKLTRGRLSELAWSLDVRQPTEDDQQKTS